MCIVWFPVCGNVCVSASISCTFSLVLFFFLPALPYFDLFLFDLSHCILLSFLRCLSSNGWQKGCGSGRGRRWGETVRSREKGNINQNTVYENIYFQ